MLTSKKGVGIFHVYLNRNNMISNYNLDCDYHNFELKDKIYLIPESALKIIYTDGYNEAVFTGDSSNVTILEGYDISFQEESSFDERFKFSRTLSIKVDGYRTFNDLNYRYMAIIETKDGEFYIVNSDFQSFVTHTYTLTNGTNSTEFVFSSQSNIPTIKLTGFEPNVVNSCKGYSFPKVKNIFLTEYENTSLSTWSKKLINKVDLSEIKPLPDSVSLTEEFDGEKYTVTLGFDIPMSYYKNDWHIKLLQFTENKYSGYIALEDGNKAFVGYNVGLFPSYTINGDIISIRLTETAIRGIAYGNEYGIVDTDMPNIISFNGATCYTYNWNSSCDWNVEDKPDYITIAPTSGLADTDYVLTICNTDDETGYAVSEFVINTCNARVRYEVVIKNPIYRWVQTEETMCIAEPTFDGKYKLTLSDSSIVSAACDSTSAVTESDVSSYTNSVVSVEIGNCVTDIDEFTFSSCDNLSSLTLGNAISTIGDYAFQSCSKLTSIHIPSNVVSLGNNVFQWCTSVTSITVNNSNSVYDSRNNCNAIIETSSNTLLQGCANTIIPNNVINIGPSSFVGLTNLSSIVIPDSVTTIGEMAFYNCTGATSCTIGNNVETIGHRAFSQCYSLSNVTIPASVLSIDMFGFLYCTGLTSITCLATTPPTLGSSVFDSTNDCPIYVPSGSVNTYKTATNWSTYADRIRPIPS